MSVTVVDMPFIRRGAVKDLFHLDMRGEFPTEILVEGPAGTGKSRGWGEFLYKIMHKYDGSRGAILRKTRVSLTESFLVTWESEVVPPEHPMLEGPTRAHRQSYRNPDNGSEIWIGGLDNPTRLYSAQFDWIYVQEATELTLDEWERLGRALRNHKMPYQFIGADCNPDAPSHWLNQRCLQGKTKRLISRHRDNPSIKPAYLERLKSLSGVRRRRLFEGEWCAAEGAVWAEFDRSIHVVNKPLDEEGKPTLRPLDLRWFFGSVDWGFTAPGVFAVWGVDGEGRMYCVAEVYQTGKSLAWWCERAVELDKEFNLLSIVCDPARPDAIRDFNIALASSRGGALSGVARAADNRRASSGMGDLSGIDLVRQRLAPESPGIFWLADCLRYGRDASLVEASQPCSTVEEIPSVVYLQSGDGRANREHVDPTCADHGFDTTRYAASFANMREWGPHEEEKPKYGEGTYGALFDHESWEDA